MKLERLSVVVDYDAIGLRIRLKRVKLGLNQGRLAEKAKLSLSHVCNIETGNTKLSLPTIIKLANALDTSVDALLCDNLKQAAPIFQAEAQEIFSGCSRLETRIMLDILKCVRAAFEETNPRR